MTKLTREDVIKSIINGNKDFIGWDLSALDLNHSYFVYANLQGANLQGANLEGANLEGANLEGAYFLKASDPS